MSEGPTASVEGLKTVRRKLRKRMAPPFGAVKDKVVRTLAQAPDAQRLARDPGMPILRCWCDFGSSPPSTGTVRA
ncbi:MAG: hypothetical protein M3313_11795, partial [Actinomycetota bacterium]|nr:hypothetical protein [Actinomycetota bacterium]